MLLNYRNGATAGRCTKSFYKNRRKYSLSSPESCAKKKVRISGQMMVMKNTRLQHQSYSGFPTHEVGIVPEIVGNICMKR